MTPTAAALADLGERYFRTQHSYDPYNATLLGITEFDGLAGDPSRAASAAAAASSSRSMIRSCWRGAVIDICPGPSAQEMIPGV